MTSAAPSRGPRQWSLQARLITAIVAVVALILVMVAIATSAVLGRVLQDNLNAQVQSAAQQTAGTLLDLKIPRESQQVTASEVLQSGNQPQGTVLVLRGGGEGTATGAYVAGPGDIVTLTDIQVEDAAPKPGVVVRGDENDPGPVHLSWVFVGCGGTLPDVLRQGGCDGP